MDVTRDEASGTVSKRAGTLGERQALAREASNLRAVAHPGVVRLIQAEGGDPPDALVLALVDGGNLAEIAAQPVEVVAGIGAALATTVADLHDIGFVHGAICPEHVLIDDQGRPVLCSFGQAGKWHAGGDLVASPSEDVAALGRLLLSLLPSGADRRIRSVLNSAAGRGRRGPGRRRDARRLAAQLVRSVPGARLPGQAAHPDVPAVPAGPARGVRHLARPRAWVAAGAAVAATALGLSATLAWPPARSHPPGPPAAPSTSVPCPPVDLGCGPLAAPRGVMDLPQGRYRLSSRSPVVTVVGRWDCSSGGLPASIDLASGDLWVFDAWPATGTERTGHLLLRVAHASGLWVRPMTSGCDELEVARSGAGSVQIDPRIK
jgi:tRNA A-37 threonylcarbamoyl transferase component Bud32